MPEQKDDDELRHHEQNSDFHNGGKEKQDEINFWKKNGDVQFDNIRGNILFTFMSKQLNNVRIHRKKVVYVEVQVRLRR